MALKKSISVRLDNVVLRAIDKLAAKHERSREGEIRWLLAESVRQLELKFTAEWTAVPESIEQLEQLERKRQAREADRTPATKKGKTSRES